MSLVLSNPAGLWALLGIPAVLLIHLLQRRAQVVPAATLFLLEQSQREAAGGRQLERLVASLPLWMQLLAVLLLTWLLVEPRDGALAWHALVRNYSPLPATRSWAVERPDGSRTQPTPLTLAPGALARLDGVFPAGTPRLRVVLDPDWFTLDDTLPLVAPLPKPLAIHALPAPETDALARRLADALEAAHLAPDAASADVLVARVDPPAGPLPPANAIVFAATPDPGPTPSAGPVLTATDPLVDGLDWQPLEAGGGAGLAAAATDRVLLWQEGRPLVVLRVATAGEPPRPVRQLLFQFDLRHSNAARLPAFAVLLHRFCAAVREAKVAPARAVLETGEPVTLAADPAGPQLDVQALALDGSATTAAALPAAARVRTEAPRDPGFVTIRQGGLALLDAATHFGDTREADFSACGAADDLASATPATIRRHTRADHWWRAWLLALVLALLAAWRYTEPATRHNC